MEQTARRSHEITLIGDGQGSKQIHIRGRGGNCRGNARSWTLTDLDDPSVPRSGL